MSESGSDSGSGSDAGSPPRDKRKISIGDASAEVNRTLYLKVITTLL